MWMKKGGDRLKCVKVKKKKSAFTDGCFSFVN